MTTVGLSVTVKDEAQVIARCLDSLRGLIDAAVIADTGSTGGTQRLPRSRIPGGTSPTIAHNRPQSPPGARGAAAAGDVDYALVMDAGDGLDADVHDVAIHHGGGTVYRRPQAYPASKIAPASCSSRACAALAGVRAALRLRG